MSLKLFAKHFGVLEDVRPVKDPLGLGITFFIARAGDPEFVAFQKEQQRKNPMIRELYQVGFARAVAAKDGPAPEVSMSDETFERILDADATARMNAEAAAVLVRSWDGADPDTGEPIDPYSREEAVKLFGERKVWVPPEYVEEIENGKRVQKQKPYTGMTLGDALSSWVFDEANRTEEYLGKLEEEHAKNSETSSGGD